jgi:hypothetical protein
MIPVIWLESRSNQDLVVSVAAVKSAPGGNIGGERAGCIWVGLRMFQTMMWIGLLLC